MKKATGASRDGWRGRWSYREEIAGSSNISSSSGTIVSTPSPYTHSFSPASPFHVEAAMHFDSLEINGGEVVDWEEEEEEEEIIKTLVREFLVAPSSANYSIDGSCDDISIVQERWLQQLGVGWVLHVAERASEWKLEHTFHASSWVRALAKMTKIIHIVVMALLLPSTSIFEEEEPEPEMTTWSGNGFSVPGQLQFAQFIQKTLKKMLAFVDVIAAPNAKTTGIDVLALKLSTLLRVHRALSGAVAESPWLSFQSPASTQVEKIQDEILSLLSTKEGNTGDAIWSTMELIREGSNSLSPQGSSGIHKAIPSVTNYIRFLEANYLLLAPIVSEAASLGKYVPQITRVPPLMSLIMEMASSVEENLANKSKSFPDHALRFLFLMNNVYYIKQQLHYDTHSSLQVQVAAIITHKVEAYMQSYIRASWEPMLAWLFNPTPLRLGRNYSPLSKFESEFQRIHDTQKQWKVPDPELRKTLRKAIAMKIIPRYTEYTQGNKVTTLKFSPQELQQMLQELFEG